VKYIIGCDESLPQVPTRMDFDKLIDGLRIEKPKDKEEAQEIKNSIKAFELLKKIKEKQIRTRADFKFAESVLCYKSIVFCCGRSNPCIFRNAFLNTFRISMKDYLRIKKKWEGEFISSFLAQE